MAITPAGVHNPARSFRAVNRVSPIFIRKGEGSHIWDEDDRCYIDYVMGWGLILGHCNPEVVYSIHRTAEEGIHFGAPTRAEYTLAEFIVETFPSIEMVRFVNSGSEAVMAAIQVAKAYTGRHKFLKFRGCYHGWSNEALAGSPYSTGNGLVNVCLAPYNDLEETRQVISANREQLAAVIVEPVAGNMGVIRPSPGFLEGLRMLCDEYRILLVFDEVMTGFRVAYGGAQTRYAVSPDITCLGKIIGGGVPIGAYGGSKRIMSHLAPGGTAYQGGTYSGNPLAASAGITVLNKLRQDQLYWKRLEERSLALCSGIVEIARKYGVPISTEVVGGMFSVYFCEEKPHDYESVQKCDIQNFSKFFGGMLSAGVYWPPSQFEAAHISTAHDDHDLELTLAAVTSTFSLW